MLSPDDQLLLTEALRPPVGFEVECAIATTYSLTVESVLVAPMSFAMAHGDELPQESQRDTVGVLDAVQRYIDATTVFVQSGGIHIPSSHSRIQAFLEDSIVEVEPPDATGSFHPKVWAIRYEAQDSDPHHRLIVTSRNLTQDSSWDTILVLDQSPDGVIDGGPAGDFVRRLPGLATRPADAKRVGRVEQLADSLENVRFAVPAPYSGGALLPTGVGSSSWPFSGAAKKTLVISPFLAAGQLDTARSGAETATLISRADSMNALGRRALDGWATRVLHAAAEGAGDDDAEPDDSSSASVNMDTGLHAKTVVLDTGNGESVTVTGSANMTQSAWTRNVEFNAVLRGPTSSTGVDAVLDGGDAPVGLRSITEPYTPEHDDPETDAERAVRYRIEHFHRELARRQPILDVSVLDDDSVSIRLDLDVPDDDLSATTTVWLQSVTATARTLETGGTWTVAPVNVTRFLAVETTANVDGTDVTRRCVLTCALSGDHIDRRRAALSAILSNPRSVLLYLAMLLGLDPNDAALASAAQEDVSENVSLVVGSDESPAALPPIVLFEPLMHATREPAQLAKVARQIEELRTMPGAEERIPQEFLAMWDVVLTTVRPRSAE